MRPLVLASTSRYRKTLIERLELAVTTAAPDFDERAAEARLDALTPAELAGALARGKAESLRSSYPDAWILGADQVPVLRAREPGARPEILHKPETEARAVDQLMRLAGRAHEMLTAVALLDARTGAITSALDRQTLIMRRYTRAEAAAYIRRHRPLDCAGSYRIEDPGIKLFASIEGGDFTGIIGLPLLSVTRLLRAAGLLPADDPSAASG
jgi:septum formation protein